MSDHGTISRYNKYCCTCDLCRKANRDYHAERRNRLRGDKDTADQAGHGKRSTYVNYGCRCDLCREANRKYRTELKKRNA